MITIQELKDNGWHIFKCAENGKIYDAFHKDDHAFELIFTNENHIVLVKRISQQISNGNTINEFEPIYQGECETISELMGKIDKQ